MICYRVSILETCSTTEHGRVPVITFVRGSLIFYLHDFYCLNLLSILDSFCMIYFQQYKTGADFKIVLKKVLVPHCTSFCDSSYSLSDFDCLCCVYFSLTFVICFGF